MAKRVLALISVLSALLASGKKYDPTVLPEPPMVDPPEIAVSVSGSYPSDIHVSIITDFEGCVDELTWPGASSGPTIGCGIDLANIGLRNVRRIFDGIVPDSVLSVLEKASKIRGSNSQAFVRRNRVKLDRDVVTLSRDRMLRIMWVASVERFPMLDTCPGEVKTAVLSVMMNRGPNNKDLDVLRAPLLRGDYNRVASLISNMQQDHDLRGIPQRRKQEAELVMLADSRRNYASGD